MTVRAYECSVKRLGFSRVVVALSEGKAKSEYWRDVRESYPDLPYLAVSSRVVPIQTPPEFARTAEYRGVPFARVGMRVEVDGNRGILAGSNSSANFDVLFDEGKFRGQTLNCHPQWMMTYFAPDGSVLAQFGDGSSRGAQA